MVEHMSYTRSFCKIAVLEHSPPSLKDRPVYQAYVPTRLHAHPYSMCLHYQLWLSEGIHAVLLHALTLKVLLLLLSNLLHCATTSDPHTHPHTHC